MKTKALLLTVALGAAGTATSMAQVFSQNAVGYINIPLAQGYNLIANQLLQTSQKIIDLMPAPVPGTVVTKFEDNGSITEDTYDAFDLVWMPNGDLTLTPGRGAWVYSPSASTLTLVGEVPQGPALTTPTPIGFSVRSSQVPQAGTMTQLSFTPGAGDVLYLFENPPILPHTTPGYNQFTFDAFDLVWQPSEPSLKVGEAFWHYHATATPSSWVRSFSVN